MNPCLMQLRDGIAAHIAESPVVVTPMRCPLVADPFGGTSRSGTPTAQAKARVRLQHESGSIQSNAVKPSGLDTNLSLYVLTDHRAPLVESDTFEAFGFTWTVGPINTFRHLGYPYKTEAPLVKGTAVLATVSLAFTATPISDTEIDLTWEDMDAVGFYSIERRTGTDDFARIGIVAAGVEIYHDTGLTPETAYDYRVLVYSGSTYEEEDTATTEETPA